MKTTFKQFLQEQTLPKASSEEELLSSIKNGKFTLDGSDLKIDGDFYCYNNKLTSLQGAPSSVGDRFGCNDNQLTSLQGAPQSVGGDFNCPNNKLTSLDGAPQSVDGHFVCHHNKLTSLHDIHKHIKEIKGYAYFEKTQSSRMSLAC